MRRLALAAVLGSLALSAVPAAAESPVSLPELAPGEVLLEVDGVGVVRTPASTATVTTNVVGRGATEQEAQTRLQREIERVRAEARAAGASDGDITVEPVGVADLLRTFAISEAPVSDDESTDNTAQAASRITMRLRTPARAAELNSRLNPDAYGELATPTYELADPAAARRQARAAALGQARADAEAYAEALGMRIVRPLRVTDRAGFDFLPLMFTDTAVMDYLEGFERGGLYPNRPQPAEVATAAVVGVDYVLAPR